VCWYHVSYRYKHLSDLDLKKISVQCSVVVIVYFHRFISRDIQMNRILEWGHT